MRRWDAARPALGVVMLNPSTADAARDDPTICRCIAFAQRAGFGATDILNLFAFRATAPTDLRAAPDPVGPDNDAHLDDLFGRETSVLAAWGMHGSYRGRAETVRQMAAARRVRFVCLGQTVKGQPCHPLYLARYTPFRAFL